MLLSLLYKICFKRDTFRGPNYALSGVCEAMIAAPHGSGAQILHFLGIFFVGWVERVGGHVGHIHTHTHTHTLGWSNFEKKKTVHVEPTLKSNISMTA